MQRYVEIHTIVIENHRLWIFSLILKLKSSVKVAMTYDCVVYKLYRGHGSHSYITE